jgi:hypothetical protein
MQSFEVEEEVAILLNTDDDTRVCVCRLPKSTAPLLIVEILRCPSAKPIIQALSISL